MIEVTLSDAELQTASMVGTLRRTQSIYQRLKSPFKVNEYQRWGIDICGAMGEMAVAKALGIYWDCGVNTFKNPDVGNLQVRSSQYSDGRLIVRHNDKDDDIFVLVVGKAPTFTVVGWIRGEDAKQPHYMDNPGELLPAWFVPQEDLHPMEDLKEKYENESR